MRLYKFTNSAEVVSKTYTRPICDNPEIYNKNVLLAYKNLDLAYMLLELRYDKDSVCWTALGTPVVEGLLYVGCFELTTVKKLKPPFWVDSGWESIFKLKFTILCAEKVLPIYEAKSDSKRPRTALERATKIYNLFFKKDAAKIWRDIVSSDWKEIKETYNAKVDNSVFHAARAAYYTYHYASLAFADYISPADEYDDNEYNEYNEYNDYDGLIESVAVDTASADKSIDLVYLTWKAIQEVKEDLEEFEGVIFNNGSDEDSIKNFTDACIMDEVKKRSLLSCFKSPDKNIRSIRLE